MVSLPLCPAVCPARRTGERAEERRQSNARRRARAGVGTRGGWRDVDTPPTGPLKGKKGPGQLSSEPYCRPRLCSPEYRPKHPPRSWDSRMLGATSWLLPGGARWRLRGSGTISQSAEIAPALFTEGNAHQSRHHRSRPRGVHRWVRASNRHTLAPRRARTRRRAGARTRVAPGIGSRGSACNRDAPVNSDRARYKEGGGPGCNSDRPEHPPTHPSPTPSAPSFNRRSPRTARPRVARQRT